MSVHSLCGLQWGHERVTFFVGHPVFSLVSIFYFFHLVVLFYLTVIPIRFIIIKHIWSTLQQCSFYSYSTTRFLMEPDSSISINSQYYSRVCRFSEEFWEQLLSSEFVSLGINYMITKKIGIPSARFKGAKMVLLLKILGKFRVYSHPLTCH